MIYFFDEYSLDSERRELRRGSDAVLVEPQVFDLLQCLIRHRDRVVTKDDLIAEVWNRRAVSDSTLSSRITAVRHAVGDSGGRQRLIRTLARKGFRFVGVVRERTRPDDDVVANGSSSDASNDLGAPLRARLGAAERRQLTIIVCNIAETALLSTRVDPEDLREIIRKYWACITNVAEQHGGHVAKYNDDGAVVYFGYPLAHEDDAERAVRAALVATRLVKELRIECLSEPLQARIGIATGLVLVGLESTAEPAVIGEAPYVAARLQALAEPGAVVISAGTRRLVGNLFEYDDLDSSQSDGAAEPISASRVIGESPIASRFEALRSSRKRLVGREEELELLLRRWSQAKSGDGRVILIWGEPGIGKSHLVAAFQDEIAAEQHRCIRYFCSPNRIQTALHPVITQLEHAADFDSADADTTKVDKLERLLAMSSHELDKDVVLFAELLSISAEDRQPRLALSAQRRKELLMERFIAQLVELAAQRPLLMILEDVHWIDPTTRELFDVIIDRVRKLPVLLIMTYRPEFSPSWLGQSHVTAVTLNHLGSRDNAALIKQIARGKTLPPRLLEQLIKRTDGVPLFIEEVTKSVLESGMLRDEGDAYVLDGPLPVVAVPSTLQASLVARLDRIAPARAVVQTSAALGREFRYAVLKAVTALPDAELGDLLQQVVSSELVRQRGDIPDAIYAFKHALVQDAAYETIPKSERFAIHHRIADVLEQQFADLAEHHPDVLAFHCTEAGLAEKAIDYSIKAARVALNRSAGVEAQSQVEKTMCLLPKITDGPIRKQIEGRLHVVLGDALVMTKGFASPQVMATLSKARDLLDENLHPIEALGALCGLFNYHLIRSESPLCLTLAESRLRDKMDRPTATVVHYLVGTAHLHLGNFTESVRELETALNLYDENLCRPVSFIAGYHLRSFTLIWLGLAYLYVGSSSLAAQTITAAVRDARSRSHPFTLVSALLALARFRNHTGDLDGAIAATEEGMTIAADQRSPYHVSRAGILRAVNVVEARRPVEGIELLENALADHRATGADFQSSYNLSRLAEAHAQAGNRTRAIELAGSAVTEVIRCGERWWEAESQRIRGDILLLSGPSNRDEAEACFTNALQCARRQGAKLWELNAAVSLAKLWLSEGKTKHAQLLLCAVHDQFADGDEIRALKLAKQLLHDSSATMPRLSVALDESRKQSKTRAPRRTDRRSSAQASRLRRRGT